MPNIKKNRNPATFGLTVLLLLILLASGCTKSSDSPSQSGNGTWTVSGTTGLIGALSPLPGVTVRCGGQSTISGTEGSYELRGVPEGAQVISAEGPNCKPYSKSIDVRSDTRHFIYLDYNGTTLSGYVSNILDGPIEGVIVSVGTLTDLTDQAGHYEITNVPLMSDSIIVTHARYYSARSFVSFAGPDMRLDFSMQRDTVVSGRITADQYVDETQPNITFMNTRLTLGSNGYMGTVYYSNIRRHIYLNFDFPAFMKDPGVTLLDGSLELCTDASVAGFGYQVSAVTSQWLYYSLTYNQQPRLGAPLQATSIPTIASARYVTILTPPVLQQLLMDYRANGLIYGVVIQSQSNFTGTTTRSFYSMRSTINQPRVSFKARF